MHDLLETIQYRGVDIKVYGTDDDGAETYETCGTICFDQDAAEEVINETLDAGMETLQETIDRHREWATR
jgi:hypothetical protein